jgi:hypothetical protein
MASKDIGDRQINGAKRQGHRNSLAGSKIITGVSTRTPIDGKK